MNARVEPPPPRATRLLSFTLALLLVAAFICIQTLIGGTRLIFALPAYAILALTGVLAALFLLRKTAAPDSLCFWSALLLFGYILARAWFSPVLYLARLDMYAVAAGLLVYFLTSSVLTDARTRIWIVLGLMAFGIAQVVVGAIQFRQGDNFMPISFLQRFDYGHRASGFYICPNHLAGLLEVLGVFGLSLTLWSRWPIWSKLLIGYATGMCYIGVILSASRGGYLASLASLAVFVFFSFRILQSTGSAARARIGIAVLILAVLGCVAAFLIIYKSDYLTTRTKNVADRGNIRLDFWKAAVQQWKLEPLLGTGSRTFLFYARKFRTPSVQVDPVYVHNDYLQLLSDYGLAGVVLLAPFLILHARRGWITARRVGPRRIASTQRILSNAMALNLGAISAVAAYTVHSFFDFNLHIPANVLLMAFVFGVLANSGIIHGEVTRPQQITTFAARVLLFLGALGLGYEAWRLAPGEYFTEKARTSLRDQKPGSALNFALQGLEYEKNNPQLYLYLGKARMLSGERQSNPIARDSFFLSAVTAFGRARDLAPLDETYSVELGFAYDALKRYPEADWMYGEAVAFDPLSQSVQQYYEAHLQRWKTEGNPLVEPETADDRS